MFRNYFVTTSFLLVQHFNMLRLTKLTLYQALNFNKRFY